MLLLHNHTCSLISPYAHNPVWKFVCLVSNFSVLLAWDSSPHGCAIDVQCKVNLSSFILTSELQWGAFLVNYFLFFSLNTLLMLSKHSHSVWRDFGAGLLKCVLYKCQQFWTWCLTLLRDRVRKRRRKDVILKQICSYTHFFPLLDHWFMKKIIFIKGMKNSNWKDQNWWTSSFGERKYTSEQVKIQIHISDCVGDVKVCQRPLCHVDMSDLALNLLIWVLFIVCN